jgi:hypothetical protein
MAQTQGFGLRERIQGPTLDPRLFATKSAGGEALLGALRGYQSGQQRQLANQMAEEELGLKQQEQDRLSKALKLEEDTLKNRQRLEKVEQELKERQIGVEERRVGVAENQEERFADELEYQRDKLKAGQPKNPVYVTTDIEGVGTVVYDSANGVYIPDSQIQEGADVGDGSDFRYAVGPDGQVLKNMVIDSDGDKFARDPETGEIKNKIGTARLEDMPLPVRRYAYAGIDVENPAFKDENGEYDLNVLQKAFLIRNLEEAFAKNYKPAQTVEDVPIETERITDAIKGIRDDLDDDIELRLEEAGILTPSSGAGGAKNDYPNLDEIPEEEAERIYNSLKPGDKFINQGQVVTKR